MAELIHPHAHVLPVEIAGLHQATAVDVHERVVVDRIDLGLDLTRDGRQAVEQWSEELRQAADRVAVLNETLTFRLGRRAVRAQQLPHLCGRELLSGVRLELVHEGFERTGRGHECLAKKRIDPQTQIE